MRVKNTSKNTISFGPFLSAPGEGEIAGLTLEPGAEGELAAYYCTAVVHAMIKAGSLAEIKPKIAKNG